MLDIAHTNKEPVVAVVQERIEKVKDKMKKTKDDLKPLQQVYIQIAGEVNHG